MNNIKHSISPGGGCGWKICNRISITAKSSFRIASNLYGIIIDNSKYVISISILNLNYITQLVITFLFSPQRPYGGALIRGIAIAYAVPHQPQDMGLSLSLTDVGSDVGEVVPTNAHMTSLPLSGAVRELKRARLGKLVEHVIADRVVRASWALCVSFSVPRLAIAWRVSHRGPTGSLPLLGALRELYSTELGKLPGASSQVAQCATPGHCARASVCSGRALAPVIVCHRFFGGQSVPTMLGAVCGRVLSYLGSACDRTYAYLCAAVTAAFRRHLARFYQMLRDAAFYVVQSVLLLAAGCRRRAARRVCHGFCRNKCCGLIRRHHHHHPLG